LRSHHDIRRDVTTPITGPAGNSQQTLSNLRPNGEFIRKALISWILGDHQALQQVESSRFKQFLAAILPLQSSSLLPTRQTLRRWVLDTFDEHRVTISARLSAARSHVHISFDGWTSPNLGIVAHWTDEKYKVCSALIGLKELQYTHDGTNLATIVMNVLQNYGIIEKIGYFMCDNASNMTTAIEEISRQLFALGNTILNSSERRLRCWGHAVNLSAKDVLGGRGRINDSALAIGDPNSIEEERAAFVHWCQNLAVDKLLGFTVFVNASPARRNLFISVQQDHLHQLKAWIIRRMTSTRWGSAHDMIHDGLRLRDAIDIFLGVLAAQQPQKRDEILSHQLTTTEWDELQKIHDLLSPLKEVSSLMEGNIVGPGGYHGNGALCDVLPGFDHLLNHFERAKTQLMESGDTHLATCVNLAWSKLDKYYQYTDDSAVYLVATVLDPRLKFGYFEKAWAKKPEWLRTAKQRLYKYDSFIITTDCRYRDDYATLMVVDPLPESIAIQPSNPRHSEFLVWKYGRPAITSASDELDKYLGAERETQLDLDVHAWWMQHQKQYPLLFRMAMDIMAIPAMASEVERVFSRHILSLTILTIIVQSC